jgi:hypothetical protein
MLDKFQPWPKIIYQSSKTHIHRSATCTVSSDDPVWHATRRSVKSKTTSQPQAATARSDDPPDHARLGFFFSLSFLLLYRRGKGWRLGRSGWFQKLDCVAGIGGNACTGWRSERCGSEDCRSTRTRVLHAGDILLIYKKAVPKFKEVYLFIYSPIFVLVKKCSSKYVSSIAKEGGQSTARLPVKKYFNSIFSEKTVFSPRNQSTSLVAKFQRNLQSQPWFSTILCVPSSNTCRLKYRY